MLMSRIRVTYPSQPDPSNSPFEFTWVLPAGGHRWIEAISAQPEISPAEPQKYLTDGNPLGSRYEAWRYAPLRAHPALFRTFATLEPTEEGVKSFSDLYGALGGEVRTLIVLPLAANKPPGGIKVTHAGRSEGVVGAGETLAGWTRQINLMRELVELWEATRSRGDVLRERIAWSDREVVYRYQGGWSIIASERTDDEHFRHLRRGDLVTPAVYHLQRRVNGQLHDGSVTARLLWDRDRTKLGVHVVPQSLLAALWLQFARAIDGERRYITCKICGRWLEVSPDARRADARYCSGACRTRAYRARVHAQESLPAQKPRSPRSREAGIR